MEHSCDVDIVVREQCSTMSTSQLCYPACTVWTNASEIIVVIHYGHQRGECWNGTRSLSTSTRLRCPCSTAPCTIMHKWNKMVCDSTVVSSDYLVVITVKHHARSQSVGHAHMVRLYWLCALRAWPPIGCGRKVGKKLIKYWEIVLGSGSWHPAPGGQKLKLIFALGHLDSKTLSPEACRTERKHKDSWESPVRY